MPHASISAASVTPARRARARIEASTESAWRRSGWVFVSSQRSAQAAARVGSGMRPSLSERGAVRRLAPHALSYTPAERDVPHADRPPAATPPRPPAHPAPRAAVPLPRARRAAPLREARRPDGPRHGRQQDAQARVQRRRGAPAGRGHARDPRRGAVEPRTADRGRRGDHLLGAEVVFSGDRTREEVAGEVVARERSAGRQPFLIPVGASDEVGAVGYVAAMEELKQQLAERRLGVDRVVVASSSFGTQSGMVVGAKALGLEAQIAGIAIDSTRDELRSAVADLAARTARRVGLDVSVSTDEVVGYDGYLGAGYAIMGEAEREAIDLT